MTDEQKARWARAETTILQASAAVRDLASVADAPQQRNIALVRTKLDEARLWLAEAARS